MLLHYKYFEGKTPAQATPIVILHGLFGMLDNWQNIAKSLAEQHFSVYILDLRNHGNSPHATAFNYSLLSTDLLAFFEQQSLPAAYLVGHSMGGKVAMHFACAHPQLVQKLVVVDICPKQYPDVSHNFIFKALFSLDLQQITNRKQAEIQLQTQINDFATLQFLLKNLYRNNETGTYHWRFNLQSLFQNYELICQSGLALQATFGGDTLFMAGSKSNYILPSDWETYILPHFANAQLISIEGAGHWIHAEQPQAFIHTLKSYLSVGVLLLLLFLGAGCESKSDKERAKMVKLQETKNAPIALEPMSRILCDIHIADALTELKNNKDTTNFIPAPITDYYAQIFDLHNVTPQKFEEAFQYYAQHVSAYDSLYTVVSERLKGIKTYYDSKTINTRAENAKQVRKSFETQNGKIDTQAVLKKIKNPATLNPNLRKKMIEK